MAWKRLPRRLRHGDEATLVAHLGHLRACLAISLAAVAVAQLSIWLAVPMERRWNLAALDEELAAGKA